LPSEFKAAQYRDIKGSAFVKGAGDVEDVDINDVAQRQLGDCGLHAAMIAIAKVNPQAIRDLIRDNKDGTYTVTLYFEKHLWNNKYPHEIKVTPSFPTDVKSGVPLFSQPGDIGSEGTEFWAMLIEKAFAIYKGGYQEIEGISPQSASEMLSKEKASESHGTEDLSEDNMGKALKEKVDSGKFAVTASTNLRRISKWLLSKAEEQKAEKIGIVFDHAYTIVKVNENEKTLDLYNPWGFNHLIALSFADFRKYFALWFAVQVKK
jgi:hypothetical protein